MVKFLLICLTLWSSLCGGEVLFILTSDLHGGLKKFSHLAPVIRRYPSAVKADAGDIFQGDYFVDKSSGLPMLKALDSLGYDLIVPGNHDLEYPLETMQNWSRNFSGKILAGQWHLKGLDLPGMAVVARDGYKLGIIALGDVGIKKRIAFLPGLSYSDEVEIVRNAVEVLKKEQCHAFILLCHIGVGNFGILNKIVREIPEIDLIAGAHSHRADVGRRIGRALAVQAGAHGECAVLLRFNFAENGRLQYIRSELLYPEKSADPEIYALYRDLQKKFSETSFLELGKFSGADEFGMVAAEIIRKAAATDGAFFRFPSERFPKLLSEEKLFYLLPYGNRIIKITADGDLIHKFIGRRRHKSKRFFKAGNFSKKGKITVAVSDYFFLKEKDLHEFEVEGIGKFERIEIIKALKSGEYREFLAEKVEKSPSGTKL